jgi:hypothetical protein
MEIAVNLRIEHNGQGATWRFRVWIARLFLKFCDPSALAWLAVWGHQSLGWLKPCGRFSKACRQ